MTPNQSFRFDLFALGEALIDLISDDVVDSIGDATHFERFLGGQPANLAINMELLGRKAALASCLGEDGFGHYIFEQLQARNVNTGYIQFTDQTQTAHHVIARHNQTADFISSRGADSYLTYTSKMAEAASRSRIVHTSAYSLTRDPARSTILRILRKARDRKCLISLDPNYHPKIWPDIPGDFVSLLRETFELVDISKPSLDDCNRLFGSSLNPIDYVKRFLDWGCQIVMLTMGEEGVLLATADGEIIHIHSERVNVTDATGAGDAYWAGFFDAYLDGASPLDAARFGQVLAQMKIQSTGPLNELSTDRSTLYQRSLSVLYTDLTDQSRSKAKGGA